MSKECDATFVDLRPIFKPLERVVKIFEGDIFYVALFPDKTGTIFNRAKLDEIPDRMAEVLPENAKYANVIRFYELRDRKLRIISDVSSRKVICFFD